ncbi:MAG: phage head morphogenesis protein, partial [Lachnospiraceae bacterium]|nr:phage head morphogenesis protein [Lachnospiraceae bacterium]
MAIRILPPKRVKKAKSRNSQEVLRRLEQYLENECDDPVRILCGFWEDQQNAISYQELRAAVMEGYLSMETLRLWQQDYSVLVANRLGSMWTNAAAAGPSGQPVLDNVSFKFDTQTSGMMNWIKDRGAEFVTASTQEQKDAIAALLTKKMRDSHTVDELSRLIRPCIGLTERDAKAVARFYDNISNNLKKEHPRMKPESIRRKALDASGKYAERKHRARAMTIAQTESAFAYNRGADEGVRQAQEQGLLGKTIKKWSTSGDDGVCDLCASVEGVE